jgi:hypothetical protein
MAEALSLSEAYITARQAWWAGDLVYCLRALTETGADGNDELASHDEYDPVRLLRWRANQLYAQVLRGLKEERQPDPAFIVETRHLRGAFHQASPRLFEFRAFMRDLTWDEELFRRATMVAGRYGRQVAAPSAKYQEEEENAGTINFDDPELSWLEIRDHMLVEVSISEFALLRAQLTWTSHVPPADVERIHLAFLNVLRSLESVR